MKKFVLMCIAGLVITGCGAKKPLRTGTICIPDAITKGYTTTDAIDIRQDVVDHAGAALKRTISLAISDDTAMTYSEDCSKADWLLLMYIRRLDGTTPHRGDFLANLTNNTTRRFKLEVNGVLKNRKTDSRAAGFDESVTRTGLDDTIDKMASNIIKEIKRPD